MTSPLMQELTTKYPEACALIVKILQNIDAEKRSDEHCDDDVKESFCLSDMNELVGDTVAQLSSSDMTPTNADHALRVMWDFFVDFESGGNALQSSPGSSQKPKGYARAMAELAGNDDAKLYEVELGLFNIHDGRTPFAEVQLLIATDDEESVNDLAIEFAEENIPAQLSSEFRVIGNATEVNPADYQ